MKNLDNSKNGKNGLQNGSVLAKTPTKAQIGNDFQCVRTLCLDALNACSTAKGKCIAAGHALLELRARANGDFMDMVAERIPEVSHRTVNMWMKAAENVLLALPPAPVIEIEGHVVGVSGILTLPENNLPGEALIWRRAWIDFTEDKTIKECMTAVLVEGDDGSRIDRAINGKLKGGSRGEDRKDYPFFAARKFRDIATHMSHWDAMAETQRTELKSVLVAAIIGDEVKLRGRDTETWTYDAWPAEVCEVVMEAIKERMKGLRK